MRCLGQSLSDGLVAMDGSEAAIFAVDTFKQRSNIEGVVGFTVVNAGVGQVDDFTTDELQSGLGDPLPEFGILASPAVRRLERTCKWEARMNLVAQVQRRARELEQTHIRV